MRTQVLDTLVVQSPAENSSLVVGAWVDPMCLRCGLVFQPGAVIDWGLSLTRLAKNALRQVCLRLSVAVYVALLSCSADVQTQRVQHLSGLRSVDHTRSSHFVKSSGGLATSGVLI